MTLTSVVLAAPLLLIVVWISTSGFRLLRNYLEARAIGIPVRVIPISPMNPFWVLLDRKILYYVRLLPFSKNSFTRYNWRGWEIEDRYQSHQEMGDIWVLVTPFKNWIYINDPETLMSIYRRPADFPHPAFITG
jgi:hypothetical protein